MAKKTYCSIGKVPKGQKLGSMKECLDKNQVRYWGVKKIDPKLLELGKKKKDSIESLEKLYIKLVTLRGRIKGINKKLADEKDKKEKDKLNKELLDTKNELTKTSVKVKKLESQQSRNFSRKSSRKSYKKASRKSLKRSSRKSSKRSSKKGSRKSSRKVSRKKSRKISRRKSRKISRKKSSKK